MMLDPDDPSGPPERRERRETDILRRFLAERLPYTSELLTADQRDLYADVIVALHRLVISLSP
jgi:hypothetical protein